MTDNLSNKKKPVSIWRPIILVMILVAVIILLQFLGVGEKLSQLRNWITSLGSWGPLVFVLIYIAAVIAAFPGSAITIAGAALFGSVWGVVLVSIASTIGASIGFLISRYVARDYILSKLSKNEKFLKLDQLTKEHGAIIVAITRLIPLFPFNILNYGFGLTGVRFWTYVFWSWLCMLPGTILYVVGTDAVVSGIAQGEIPWALIIVVLVAGIILAFVVRAARKKLAGSDEKI